MEAYIPEELYKDEIHLVGVSYKTLCVEGRETLVQSLGDSSVFLKELVDHCGLKEAALLSTCNRFEITAIGSDVGNRIAAFLRGRLHGHGSCDCIYLYRNADAVRHFLRVTSSLDSMVVGEPQILGQVKEAYQLAVSCGCVGENLHMLFQSGFRFAKKVRTNTSVASGGVSVSFVAVQLARQIFGDLDGKIVMLIGSGDMAELAALHLKSYGCRNIIIANRTVSKARNLADQIGGSAIPLMDIEANIKSVDVIIGSIRINKPLIETAFLKRQNRQRPLFMIDLGVPRNFSAALGEIDNIYLYNIDDLSAIADQNRALREEALQDAEVIIEYGLFHFEKWLVKASADPAVIDFRSKVKAICKAELEKTVGSYIEEADLNRVVELLSHRISQKVSHDLTELLQRSPNGTLDPAHLYPLLGKDTLDLINSEK